jgi:hypothetical protein
MTQITIPGMGVVEARLRAGRRDQIECRWGGIGQRYAVLTIGGKDIGAAGTFEFGPGRGTDSASRWRAGLVGTRFNPATAPTADERITIESAVLAAFDSDLGEASQEMIEAKSHRSTDEADRIRHQVAHGEAELNRKRKKIRDLEG